MAVRGYGGASREVTISRKLETLTPGAGWYPKSGMLWSYVAAESAPLMQAVLKGQYGINSTIANGLLHVSLKEAPTIMQQTPAFETHQEMTVAARRYLEAQTAPEEAVEEVKPEAIEPESSVAPTPPPLPDTPAPAEAAVEHVDPVAEEPAPTPPPAPAPVIAAPAKAVTIANPTAPKPSAPKRAKAKHVRETEPREPVELDDAGVIDQLHKATRLHWEPAKSDSPSFGKLVTLPVNHHKAEEQQRLCTTKGLKTDIEDQHGHYYLAVDPEVARTFAEKRAIKFGVGHHEESEERSVA